MKSTPGGVCSCTMKLPVRVENALPPALVPLDRKAPVPALLMAARAESPSGERERPVRPSFVQRGGADRGAVPGARDAVLQRCVLHQLHGDLVRQRESQPGHAL